MLKGAVAKRYAKALYEVAREKQATERVATDMALVAKTVQESADLQKTLLNPTIPMTVKQQIIADVFQTSVHEVVINFLNVLVQRHREAYISVLAEEFNRLADAEKGRVQVHIESAIALSDSELSNVKEHLTGLQGKQVELITSVNPDLIGGVRLTIGDRVIDASVKTQLEKFRNTFAQSSAVR
ncbi:F0F1 ATP synthase subunit delta [Fodinisporobacter ferrooxydans]|uniref:ATP synthase subunit delta n=1 Tax=Fodinisporobacter ferrooxydans TaxID=2901836 RepID=A0ABY4CQ71_9BACL|nr:F0F1 ATP synthase subunit delta [Alicyclobacillaceae bacterium MYW30-H2]